MSEQDYTEEALRNTVRDWIDRDEDQAHIAIDEFLRGCEENGITPTFEEYYGSLVQMACDDELPEGLDPVTVARYVALGYVLRGRLDEMMPKVPA